MTLGAMTAHRSLPRQATDTWHACRCCAGLSSLTHGSLPMWPLGNAVSGGAPNSARGAGMAGSDAGRGGAGGIAVGLPAEPGTSTLAQQARAWPSCMTGHTAHCITHPCRAVTSEHALRSKP